MVFTTPTSPSKSNKLSSIHFVMGPDVGEDGGGFICQHILHPFAVGNGEGVETLKFSGEGMSFKSRIVGIASEPLGTLGEFSFFLCRKPAGPSEKVGRKLYLHRFRGYQSVFDSCPT